MPVLLKRKSRLANSTPVLDAVALLKELSGVKFGESLDVSVNLGVDPA